MRVMEAAFQPGFQPISDRLFHYHCVEKTGSLREVGNAERIESTANEFKYQKDGKKLGDPNDQESSESFKEGASHS